MSITHRDNDEIIGRAELDDIEAILAITNTDVDEVLHAVKDNADALFTWDYSLARPQLRKLYEKGKTGQWNATTDLPWDTEVDLESVVAGDQIAMAAGLIASAARRSDEWDEGKGVSAQAQALRSRVERLAEANEEAYLEALALIEGASEDGDRDQAIRAGYEVNLSPVFRADEDAYAVFHEMATRVPAARKVIELQLQAILGHDTSARLDQISTPTLIVHGTVDGVLPFANGEQIASLMPTARLDVLEDVGHMFWWEQPQRSAELIREHALAAGRA